MLTVGNIYKVDLAKSPVDCAMSNMPRICTGDVVKIKSVDTYSFKYWRKRDVLCYNVVIIMSAIPRASKNTKTIGKVPECILTPHRIDLSIDKNLIKGSVMYKTHKR